jgi:PAS domain S-box-containing protein
LKLTGFTREEVIGSLATDLNVFAIPEDRLELRRRIAEEGICRDLEVTLRMKSGKLRYGLAGATVIDINGRPCILGVFFDITRRKELEKEILRLDRFNLIGQMSAGIGHEIRNPMTSVRGFLQLIEGKYECQDYKEYFKLMIDELDRANSIITEFLSLAGNKKYDANAQKHKTLI